MKNKLVVGNMKMNLTYDEVKEYIEKISKVKTNNHVVICPSAIYAPYFLNHDFEVGVQNAYKKEKGAYTGEISPKQLKSLGVKYVIIGHSERRQYFNEDDNLINEKIKECIKNGLTPILCVGETKKEKDLHLTKRRISSELKKDLKDIDENNIVVAYEPIWAIGTGVVPTEEEIDTTTKYIKEVIKKINNKNFPVLYGGSVNEENIASLNKIESVDGFLVGGASNNADSFEQIINTVLN